MKPVNVGLIGAGFHARSVLIPALSLVEELRWVAVATSREETARQASARYRVEGYPNYLELLNRKDIEAVIVAASSSLHETICRAALERGKHVYLETPGLLSVAGGAELAALARRLNLGVQVGYVFRYSQAVEFLKSHMDAQPGPRLLSIEYFPFLQHMYNLALYFCGPLERVLAATQDSAGSSATLRFRNGDTALIVGRSLANCSVNIENIRVSTPTFYAAIEGRQRVRILAGMEPVKVEDWSVASAIGLTSDPQPFAASFLEAGGSAPQFRAFASMIREGRPPRSTLDDAIETRKLKDEIDRMRS